jgi:hypothetical protein
MRPIRTATVAFMLYMQARDYASQVQYRGGVTGSFFPGDIATFCDADDDEIARLCAAIIVRGLVDDNAELFDLFSQWAKPLDEILDAGVDDDVVDADHFANRIPRSSSAGPTNAQAEDRAARCRRLGRDRTRRWRTRKSAAGISEMSQQAPASAASPSVTSVTREIPPLHPP